MKRKIITIAFVVVSFLLQTTIFDKLTIAGIKPNLFVVLTAAFGFMRGRKTGMSVGLLCGILSDVFWGGLIGFYMLIYCIIGYINGSFRRLFYEDDIKLPMVFIGISDLLFTAAVYVGYFVLQGKFMFMFFLKNVMLPEFAYTILVTVVMYQVILYVNRKLEIEEQRSASRFV